MVPAPSLVSACTVPLVRTRPGQEAGGYHASRLARHVASHSAGHPSTFPPRFALQHSSSRPRGSLPNDHAEAFAYLTHIHRNLYSRPVRVPEEDATADSGPAGLVQALANWCSSRSLHASGVPGAPAERPPRPRPPPRSSSHSPFLRAGHGTRQHRRAEGGHVRRCACCGPDPLPAPAPPVPLWAQRALAARLFAAPSPPARFLELHRPPAARPRVLGARCGPRCRFRRPCRLPAGPATAGTACSEQHRGRRVATQRHGGEACRQSRARGCAA